MHRRDFMLLLAAGTAGALASCSTGQGRASTSTSAPVSTPATSASGPSPTMTPSASPTPTRSPLWLQDGAPELPPPSPPEGIITGLPEGVGDVVALTIDDGADASVIDAYLDFAVDSGVRLTFFVTGQYPGWTECRDKMLPLVDSGQVQLANHTWTHAGLTDISDSQIVSELTQCEQLLTTTFGVTGAPFVRPPYGYRSERTDAVCASIGYSTTALWYGSFGDSGLLTQEVLLGEARTWLQAGHIVLGHANAPTVTELYGQIVEILRERSLRTVTLDDVYFGPGHDRHV